MISIKEAHGDGGSELQTIMLDSNVIPENEKSKQLFKEVVQMVKDKGSLLDQWKAKFLELYPEDEFKHLLKLIPKGDVLNFSKLS